MSRRVFVVGGEPTRRAALVSLIDAAFDVDVASATGPLEALRLLPNSEFGLILVLQPSPADDASPMDLLRFLSGHARHARTPVVLLDCTDGELIATRALGARALPAGTPDADVRALVQDLLGLG